MHRLKGMLSILLVVIIVLALDAVWLHANKGPYVAATEAIQKTPMKMHIPSAALSYACIILALYILVIPRILEDQKEGRRPLWVSCILHGGLLGFIIYGVYNFTNKALFTLYPWHIVIRDTLWGAILFTLSSWIYVGGIAAYALLR
jgi:uncharacterized membrane protein